MARQSQTDLAVLGALSIEPMTGYELRQAITEVLGHFWHESFGQIYPCLANLQQLGFVRSTSADRSSTYRITAAGRRELARRLRDEPERQQPRNATLLRVFFGASLDEDDLVAILDRTERQAREQLATLAAAREQIANGTHNAAHGRYWLATVSAGEHAARAQLDWVNETRTTLLAPQLSSGRDSP
ncbi:MAG: PadR family transcriptional regulator [Actinobacteria bacterium]|nr:PadR family transcriptional regulator [Actinomycetota bacterium]